MQFLVPVAHAAESPGVAEAQAFVDQFNQIILFPFLALLFAIALLVFLWGCFEYIKNAEDSKAHEQGRAHILWGIIGMLVMLVAFAILNIAAGTFGLEDELECANDPSAPGCNNSVFDLDSLMDTESPINGNQQGGNQNNNSNNQTEATTESISKKTRLAKHVWQAA